MFKKIMACSDGSEHALEAVHAAAEMAKKFDAEVILLAAFNPMTTLAPGAFAVGAVITMETVMECAEDVLDSVEESARKVLEEVGARYRVRRELGHPVDQIVSVAEEEQADLIVMGSRGMGGFKRFLLGSVSDGVLHHAHCPVLIVR